MILDTLAAAARKRVERAKQTTPFSVVKERAKALECGDFRFERALRAADFAFICEVKRASPSKGVLSQEFCSLEIANEYTRAGADAISVLTEPDYFLCSDAILREIRACVKTPLLRKDFTVDEYQLYEAKLLGADAVLLICALLDGDTLRRCLAVCGELGLSALVEAHTEAEVITALKAGASMVGVNNRDLNTFAVDLNTCLRLRPLVPNHVLYVAESGISTPQDIALLKSANVHAALIGEALMKSPDKKAALAALRGGRGSA